jgi:hypothetical protein
MKAKKKNKLTQLDILKMTRKVDRQLAIESGEFHKWMPTSRVHKDKKKDADKKASRNYRYKGND